MRPLVLATTLTKNVAEGELVITRAPERKIAGWQRPAKKEIIELIEKSRECGSFVLLKVLFYSSLTTRELSGVVNCSRNVRLEST